MKLRKLAFKEREERRLAAKYLVRRYARVVRKQRMLSEGKCYVCELLLVSTFHGPDCPAYHECVAYLQKLENTGQKQDVSQTDKHGC